MTSEDAEAVRMAARVAEQILQRTRDGDKLLSVTYNYPRGANAYWTGVLLAMGALTSISAFMTIVILTQRIFS